MSVRDAHELLGHSDPRMTLAVYARATDSGKRAAADAIASHFLGRATG